MVDARDVRKQLRRIGADYRFWGAPEIRELPKILFDNETIRHAINGRYRGGFAMLVSTDIRVLLIDKKPLFLTLEDIRYDMVSDVMFNHRLLNASIIIGTVHNSFTFVGFNSTNLRNMTNFIQQRVMDYRRHAQHQQPEPAVQQFSPLSYQSYDQPPVVQYQPDPSATDEPGTYQPIPTATTPVSSQLPINPYKMPITIRRRSTGRFY